MVRGGMKMPVSSRKWQKFGKIWTRDFACLRLKNLFHDLVKCLHYETGGGGEYVKKRNFLENIFLVSKLFNALFLL